MDKPYSLGFSLLLFLFASLILKSLSLWFKITNDPFCFILAIGLTAALILIQNRDLKSRSVVVFGFLGVLALSFGINKYQLDLSFDGNWYQKEAILQISKGWNPLRDGPLTAIQSSGSIYRWINYYCKTSWIIGSLFYGALGFIESAKTQNMLLIFSVYFLGAAFLQRFFKSKCLVWLGALLVALNPVALYQLFTLYVDGELATTFCLVSLFAGFILLDGRRIDFLGFCISAVILATLKPTGLVYTCVFMMALSGYILFFKKQLFKRMALTGLGAGFLIVVIGYNPYVTSWERYGSPFYPFSGGYSLSGITPPDAIIYGNLPIRYRNFNRLEKLVHSLFSESSNDEPHLKLPFTVRKGEVGIFWNNDIKIGGFGPLFSGALLITFGLMIYLWRQFSRPTRFEVLVFPVALVFLTVFINPEGSWARYIPQLYLLAPYLMFLGLALHKSSRFLKGICLVGLLSLGINSEMILENSLRRQMGLSQSLDATLRRFSGHSVLVDFGIFIPLRSRLDEYRISYKSVLKGEVANRTDGINIGDEIFFYGEK